MQLWRNAYFESLTSNISQTGRHADIILSLLESTRPRLSSGVFVSITGQKTDFLRYHEKSYTVGSVLMSRIQIPFLNENISSTLWDIVENATESNMPSRRQLWRNDYNDDVLMAIMMQCIFRIFDVEYLWKWKRYRHNSFTVGSTQPRLSSDVLFS